MFKPLKEVFNQFVENPFARVLLIAIVGAIIYYATFLISQNIPNNFIVYTGLIYIPATSLMGIALVGWILETASIKEMIIKTFSELKFIDSNFISKRKMKEITTRSLVHYYDLNYDDQTYDKNLLGFLDFYHDKVLSHLGGPYSSKSHAQRILKIDGNVLTWHQVRTNILESFKNADMKISIPFEVHTKKVDGIGRNIWHANDYIKINGTSVLRDDEVDRYIINDVDKGIKYERFVYNYDITIKPREKVSVESFITSKEVNDGDITDHITFKFPLQDLHYHLEIHRPEQYRMHYFTPSSDQTGEVKVGNSLDLQYKGWIVPGNTVTILITKS